MASDAANRFSTNSDLDSSIAAIWSFLPNGKRVANPRAIMDKTSDASAIKRTGPDVGTDRVALAEEPDGRATFWACAGFRAHRLQSFHLS